MKKKLFFGSLLLAMSAMLIGLPSVGMHNGGMTSAAPGEMTITMSGYDFAKANNMSLTADTTLASNQGYVTNDPNLSFVATKGDFKIIYKGLDDLSFKSYKNSKFELRLPTSASGYVFKEIAFSNGAEKQFDCPDYNLVNDKFVPIKNTHYATFTNVQGVKEFTSITIKYAPIGEDVPVETVGLGMTNLKLEQYKTYTFEPVISPTNASDKTLTWTSDKPEIVSVNDGVIQALAPSGSATISATSTNGKVGTCVVSCLPSTAIEYEMVKSLDQLISGGIYIFGSLDKTYGMGGVGSSSLKGSPLIPTQKDKVILGETKDQPISEYTLGLDEINGYTFTTSTNPVKYLATSQGTGANLKTNEGPFTNNEDKWNITIDPSGKALVSSKNLATKIIQYNVKSSLFSCYNISGTSKYSSIALFKKCLPNVESVTINEKPTTLKAGETITLSATVLPLEANQTVTWSSENTNLVKVDPNTGLCKALKGGKAEITATSNQNNSIKSSITIDIIENEITGFRCLNPKELKKQYIGKEFNSDGLRFAVTRADKLDYEVMEDEYTLKLYNFNTPLETMIVSKESNKVQASLNNSSLTASMTFVPSEINNIIFNKVNNDNFSSLIPGARVIITNNPLSGSEPMTSYALSKETTSTKKVLTCPVSLSDTKILVPETDIDNQPFAIYDIEKGTLDNTLALYDRLEHKYLGAFHNEKLDEIRMYVEQESRSNLQLSSHTNGTIDIMFKNDNINGYLSITSNESKLTLNNRDPKEENQTNIYVYLPSLEERVISWGDHYLMMKDPSFNHETDSGACTTLFPIANHKLLDLGDEVVSTLKNANDSTPKLFLIQNRYQAWARANNCADPYVLFTPMASGLSSSINNINEEMIIIISLVMISLLCGGGFVLFEKRRKHN